MRDLIDRQAAIDAMCLACGQDCDKSKFVYNAPQDEQVIMCPEHYALSTMPPAQPEPCEDTVSRTEILRMINCINDHHAITPYKSVGAVTEHLTRIASSLPSVTPKQRTGHWHITDAYPHNVYCSECHKRFAQTHWAVWEDGSLPRNFCPNCGAKMTEGDAE